MRNKYYVVLTAVIGVYLCGAVCAEEKPDVAQSSPAGRHQIKSKPCKHDKKMNFAEMKDKAATDPKFLAAETVPADLEIDERPVNFVVTGLTSTYALPDAKSKSFAGLKPGYKEYANCRVKDPDGKWWLATRDIGSDLTYISGDDVKIEQPESDSDDNSKSQGE
jgi:hypothetical protein